MNPGIIGGAISRSIGDTVLAERNSIEKNLPDSVAANGIELDNSYLNQVCQKCGVSVRNRINKYCGDGTDKDNPHRWAYPTVTPTVTAAQEVNLKMNIRFNERQKISLEEMSNEMGVNQANVLKKAMSFLKVVLRELKQGNQIAVVKDGKIIKEIVGILDGE